MQTKKNQGLSRVAGPQGGTATRVVAAVEERISRAQWLTPRQWEVWALIAQGLPRKEIARRWGVTLHAVDFHRDGLCRALDLRGCSDVALCLEFLRQGIWYLQPLDREPVTRVQARRRRWVRPTS
jgi:DNA-binding CsgD family transcriptional regulator